MCRPRDWPLPHPAELRLGQQPPFGHPWLSTGTCLGKWGWLSTQTQGLSLMHLPSSATEGPRGTLHPQAMLPQAWFQPRPSKTPPLLSVGSGAKIRSYRGMWLPQAGGAPPWVGANRNSATASSRRVKPKEALESAAGDPGRAGAEQS